jgi:hypothetical protein
VLCCDDGFFFADLVAPKWRKLTIGRWGMDYFSLGATARHNVGLTADFPDSTAFCPPATYQRLVLIADFQDFRR